MRRLAVLVWIAACGGDPALTDGGGADAGPDAYIGPSQALFELPRPGVPTSEYYALPFPNDLRRTPDGRIDLEGHERNNELIELYLQTISEKTFGFGTNQAIFFRFTAPIDVTSLPATAADSVGEDASVYLVNVDPDSPERGQRTPLRFRFDPAARKTIGPNWLGCLPYPGFPLQSGTTYAAVVTRRLRAPDGTEVARPDDMSSLLVDGGFDEAVQAARAVYDPLLGWLDEPSGDERTDVVAAAVFTTQDTTSLMGRLREVIWRDVPDPIPREVQFTVHGGSFDVFEGVYDAPNFQSGDPPYTQPQDGGEIVVDAVGDPIVQRMETLRFAVSVPRGVEPPDGWPIVLYGHGTGGDYISFVRDGTAERMGAQGLAVISIDAVLHGPRNPGADAALSFFNLQNPVAARDNVRQGGLDNFQLLRLADGLVIHPRHPGSEIHHFDGSRIYFMGHSQGGITGPLFLAYEPLVQGAVLSGAGGLLYLTLLEKTEPVDIPALVGSLLREEVDEFHNLFALVQMFIEPADAVNYGPLLVRTPPPGIPAKDIFQSEGLIDHYTPPLCIEALGVAIGGSPVTPIVHDVEGFSLRDAPTLTPPVVGNLGGRTAVFLQYESPPGHEGHFVVFDVEAARRQHAWFLGTLAREGRARLIP